MGAFCVFGISRMNCRKAAEKDTPTEENRKSIPVEEWGRRVAVKTEELFQTAIRRIKVSPELDAPQFCHDWLAAQPGEVKQPVIMVRGEKIDKQGGVVTRNGQPVMTWLEYDESKPSPRPFGE